MKLVTHNGRVDSSGRHNDRNFDLTTAPHILQDRIKDNRYFTYNGDMERSFADLEKDFYAEHFSEYLKKQNEKNRETGHKERNRTVLQYHRGKLTRPEDKIIQIGDRHEHVTGEQLWDVAMEYQRRFDSQFGDHCKIINMALHMDEETPHVHVRRVWYYENEDGMEQVGQNRALDALGIMEFDTSKVQSKYNNSKVTFTNMERTMIADICRERGIDLDMEPAEKRRHLSTPEFKQLQADVEELTIERNTITEELKEAKEEIGDMTTLAEQLEQFLKSDYFRHIYDNPIKEARGYSETKRIAVLMELFRAEANKVLETESFDALLESVGDRSAKRQREEIRKLNKKVDVMQHYIVDRNLGEDFSKYVHEEAVHDNKHEREEENISEKNRTVAGI